MIYKITQLQLHYYNIRYNFELLIYKFELDYSI